MSLTTVVAELYRAYNAHDAQAAAQLYAEDARHEDVAHGRPRRGRDAIAKGLELFFAWFPDARWMKRDLIAGEGAVAITYTLSGTLHAPMGPVPARGQKLELRGVHILHIRDAFIYQSDDYWDSETFKRQMSNF